MRTGVFATEEDYREVIAVHNGSVNFKRFLTKQNPEVDFHPNRRFQAACNDLAERYGLPTGGLLEDYYIGSNYEICTA